MCIVLSHDFAVVKLYRTFSTLFQGKQGVGTYANSSGWFEQIKPQTFKIAELARCVHEFCVVQPYQTFFNYIVTGDTRCEEYLCTSLGWLKHIQGKQGVENAYAIVRGGSTSSNFLITKLAKCVFYM